MSARSNGLSAHSYSVLLEIEESLGDRMLEALAERQIAAYVLPTPGPGGATRLLLHVDAQRRVPAGIVLAGLTPAPAGELPAAEADPAADAPGEVPEASETTAGGDLFPGPGHLDDAAFAEIVAGFHRTPTERSWPAAEDLPPDSPPADPPAPPTVRGSFPEVERRRPSISITPDAKADRAERAEHDDDEDRYVPAPLPKLSPSPPLTRWAFVVLFLGLALLIVPTLFALSHRSSLDLVGVIFIVGSSAVLIGRMRERSPDDPNDGAVV
jgi:hypothetical protein